MRDTLVLQITIVYKLTLKMHSLVLLFSTLLYSPTQSWSGILLNGGITQLYFPTTLPHAVSNINFGLQSCQYSCSVHYNHLSYMIGGYCAENYSNIVQIFDARTNTTTRGPPMNIGRAFHSCTVTNNTTIIVCGGINGPLIDSCEQYTYTTHAWTIIPSLPINTRSSTMITLNDHVYVFGGLVDSGGDACSNSNQVFMFDGERWSSMTNMPVGLSAHAGVQLNNEEGI
jgi:N-acetylneuraminic acid mutarotase